MTTNGLTALPYATDATTGYLLDTTQSILISPPVDDIPIPTSVSLQVEDLSVSGAALHEGGAGFGTVMHEGDTVDTLQETDTVVKQKGALILEGNTSVERSCSSVQQAVEVLSTMNAHHCKNLFMPKVPGKNRLIKQAENRWLVL